MLTSLGHSNSSHQPLHTFTAGGIHSQEDFIRKESWKSIIHCDIKPESIFLKVPILASTQPHVVLDNFGLATYEKENSKIFEDGTPGYKTTG